MVEIEGLADLMKQFDEVTKNIVGFSTQSRGRLNINEAALINVPNRHYAASSISSIAKNRNTNFDRKVVNMMRFITLAVMTEYLYSFIKKKRPHKFHRAPIAQAKASLEKLNGISSGGFKRGSSVKVNDRIKFPLQMFPHKIEYRDPTGPQGDPIHYTGWVWFVQGSYARYRRFAVTQIKVLGKTQSAGRKGTKFEGIGFEPIGLSNRAKRSSQRNQYIFFHRTKYPRRVPGEGRRRGRDGKGHDEEVTIFGRNFYPVYYEMLRDKSHRNAIINQSLRVFASLFK